jgi:hypothetical protein
MKKQSTTNDNYHLNKKPYHTPILQLYGKISHVVQGSGGGGNDGGGVMTMMSERKTKDNIVRIGTHKMGIGLYLFNYKPEYQDAGHGKQFGVMADEVETVLPGAVSTGLDGIKRVNYDMLGITLGRR